MVWEGVAVGEVSKEKLDAQKASLTQAVNTIFTKYPFEAGQAAPIRDPLVVEVGPGSVRRRVMVLPES